MDENYKLDFYNLKLINNQIFDNNYIFNQLVNELERYNIYSKYIKREKSEDEKRKKIKDLSEWFNKVNLYIRNEKNEEQKNLLRDIKKKFDYSEEKYFKLINNKRSNIYDFLYQLYNQKNLDDDEIYSKLLTKIRKKWSDLVMKQLFIK